MSRVLDRLRSIVPPRPAVAVNRTSAREGDAAACLDGAWQEHGGQRFLVVERSYAPGYRHGDWTIADALPPDEGWIRLPVLGGSGCGGRLLFVDLETTGLAGGAGSYAFLVGCGWFERGRFRVRQFFLSSFAAERALLETLRGLAAEAATVVTYNGKTFDLPLIETRFALNRLSTPFTMKPHVDMLHHARRLWRSADDGHRLATLEHVLLGHARDGDVPGFEIPARYFHYVHHGDPAPLAPVLEHNRLDLLSLALLTARAAQLIDEGVGKAANEREALGLGRLYERSGMSSEALDCFARAADLGAALRAEALRAYAVLSRRMRRHEQAAIAWQQVLDLRDCPPYLRREAAEALAVHHEHRLRNPRAARGLALQSLQMESSAARRRATEHRLARLDRKVEGVHSEVSHLF